MFVSIRMAILIVSGTHFQQDTALTLIVGKLPEKQLFILIITNYYY